MDRAQELLFGEFPRAVGSPEQHVVFSESEFDAWADVIRGDRNAYSTVSWFPEGRVVSDKVSFDFDSAEKEEAFKGEPRDDEKIRRMRQDDALARQVLGTPLEDASKLAEASIDQGIPVVAVFSGFGFHVHQLYQTEQSPATKMGTVARYWREELGLVSLDEKPIGDSQRIMRVPNMKRVYHEDVLDYTGERWDCNLWTIPLTGRELIEMTVPEILEQSRGPRPQVLLEPDPRPAMPLYEDFKRENAVERVEAHSRDRNLVGEMNDDGLHWFTKELTQMPCMYEHLILDPEPPHTVRVNSAVLMFNVGLKPGEVARLFSQLGWKDYNHDITRKHLEQIYKKGYSDMNCESLMAEGLCTRTEEPKECRAYGWSGGRPEWKQ